MAGSRQRGKAVRSSPPEISLPEVSLFEDHELASMRRVLLASLVTFAELGYHGTATRDIARRAHLSPAGLYTHYESKQALLEHIVRVTHQAMLRRMEIARGEGGTATECLRRIIVAHVRFHAKYNTATRVANYELKSLHEATRQDIRVLRDAMERVVGEVVAEGCQAREFEAMDQRVVTMFILSLGIDVGRWFRAGNRLSPDELAEEYANLVIRAITPGANPENARNSPGGFDPENSA